MGGCHGPFHEVIGGFDDVDRHLVVILERLLGIGCERFHLPGAIKRGSSRTRSEIETALVNDAEEAPLTRQSIPAEHCAARQTIEISELVHDEFFVPV